MFGIIFSAIPVESDTLKLIATEWAWLAGFIDGDGCVGIYDVQVKRGAGRYPAPRVTIAQKDRTVLDAIRDMIGEGSVSPRGKTHSGNTMHQLVFGPVPSRAICRGILPYTLVKHDQCLKVLALGRKTRNDSAVARPEADEAERLYRARVPMSEIARKLGHKPATVNYWLRRRGVTRSLAQAQQIRRTRERASRGL